MRELISGKEAKLAWANGRELVVVFNDGSHGELHDGFTLDVFSNKNIKFRLKPRTITINGIEVPAPFEPKKGECYFILNPYCDYGYSDEKFTVEYATILGAWRTEEEIKQVINALRSVFKCA